MHKRILDISYNHKATHLSSCLTAVDIIDNIYAIKDKDEKFVLSAGHAGLALYVVLEKYEGKDAEALFNKHGVHPNLDGEASIWASTGSLGQGLPIALGIAMADRSKNVYCLISDGECSEGSIWEALSIKRKFEVDNLKVYVNINGWGAYDPINRGQLIEKLVTFDPQIKIKLTGDKLPEFLIGQQGHYLVMNEEQYQEALKYYETE